MNSEHCIGSTFGLIGSFYKIGSDSNTGHKCNGLDAQLLNNFLLLVEWVDTSTTLHNS